MEGSTPKKSIPGGLIAGLAAAALSAVLVGGYFGLCAWVEGNDRLLPGAVAMDEKGNAVADLGGLTRDEALAVVTQEMDQRLDSRKLALLYGEDKRVELSGELMACSPDAAVEVGMAAKESQPLWKLGALWLGAAQEPVNLPLTAAAFTPEGEAKAKRVIQEIAGELYIPPVDFTYQVGEETVEVVRGVDGQMVDTDALLNAVEEALAKGERELRVEPEPLPGAELSGQVLDQLVHVDPKAVGVDENGRLTPAVIGISVNPEEAQTILDATGPGEPCSIPLEFTPPETSADESLYYKDLLATVTTNMDGVATRSFNVARAASFCNGKVLQPGEVFSYLDTIGDPSTANGYKPSTGYQNGETVAMDGGGVCQVSSSLYYCAVYSNLEIVRRACHAFATGYIPNGLDATVYYPSLDFKFRNSTGFPIKIVAYTEGGAYGTLTVQFYGSNPDGIKVEMQRYLLSSTPWTTVYEPDDTVPQGTTQVKTTPYTGYEVDVYRRVLDANGNQISRTYENHSRYAKRDQVILYNPLDAASLGLEPVVEPTQDPWTDPGVVPSTDPWVEPTQDPWTQPTQDPWAQPSDAPVAEPSQDPWTQPSQDPWSQPTQDPWAQPSDTPVAEPSPDPAAGSTLPPWLDFGGGTGD